MPKTRYDYAALEAEYITGDMSLRAMAEREGASNSTFSDYAKKNEWERERGDFKTKAEKALMSNLVGQYMQDMATVETEFVLGLRQAIRQFIKDLRDGKIQVSVRDFAVLIDKFQLLRGEATSRTESKSLAINGSAGSLDALLSGAPDELLRQLAELAGQNGAGAEPVGRGSLIVLEGAGEEAVG